MENDKKDLQFLSVIEQPSVVKGLVHKFLVQTEDDVWEIGQRREVEDLQEPS